MANSEHIQFTNSVLFQVFDRLRREKPDFKNYIKIIHGNLEDPSIAFSSADRDWLIENVNFVFHSAATVKFNEPLEVATKINVQGTENLLAFVAQFRELKVRIINVRDLIGKPRIRYFEKYI